MSRRFSILLGAAWIAGLLALNLAFLLRAESLRHHVDQALDRIFESKITYEEFDGGWPKDIVLRGVEVMHPDDPSSLLFSVSEIRVVINWTGALLGGSPVSEVRVVGPHLQLTWNEDGVLEVPSPLATQAGSEDDASPRVKIEGLSLHLINTPFLVKEDVEIALENFEVSLIPDSTDDWLYQFSARVDDDELGHLEARGHFDTDDFDLELIRRDFVVTEGMKRILRPEVGDLLDRFELHGAIEMVGELVSIDEEREDDGGAPTRFDVRIELAGVDLRIKGWPGPDGRLRPWPQEVTKLSGVIGYTNGRFEIQNRVIGYLEGARLWFGGHADFREPEADIRIDGGLVGLELTDAFVAGVADLPDPGPEICEQLSQWALRGPTDVGFVLEKRAGLTEDDRLLPTINVDLKGCDLTYYGPTDPVTGRRKGFPYTVRNLYGQVQLNDLGLRFSSLHGADRGMTLKARGTVDYSRAGDETYQAHVWVSGLQPDERLFAAFDEGTAEILRDLDMQGSVDLQVVAERSRSDPIGVDPTVIIGLNGLRLLPKRFPYLLEDARGQVVIGRDDKVTFESITMRHGRGRLQASGSIGIGPAAGELAGLIDLRDVAIDGSLRKALRVLVPEVDEVLGDLSAEGRIERANVSLQGTPERPEPIIGATIHLEDVAIEPEDPAVRVHDVSAVVEVWHRPGRQEIAIREGATGTIAGERFSASGRFRPGRDWVLTMSADHFVLDDEMLTALEGIAPALADRETRPEIEGNASATVVISDGPRGTKVKATIDTEGLMLRPAGWEVARLEGIDCRMVIDQGGIRIENLVARIPRPEGLPELPRIPGRDLERPFRTSPAILLQLARAGITILEDGGMRIGMGDVRLSNVPLEPWVLEIAGLSESERDALELPPISGSMDLSFTTAVVGQSSVTLNGGRADLFGVHIGPDGELYLERGSVVGLDFGLDPKGNAAFGSADTLLDATNFRLLGIPIPSLQAHVEGDQESLFLKGVTGSLLGFQYDGFSLEEATRSDLERRVGDRGYLSYSDARKKTVEQLKELIARHESFDIETADEEALRRRALQMGYVTPARAAGLSARDLRKLILDRSRAEPFGIIDGEDTKLRIDWDGGFLLSAFLRNVSVGAALGAFGGDASSTRGELKTRIALRGNIGDLSSWEGSGKVQADGIDIVELPVFLNILKTLDISTLVWPTQSTKFSCDFEVGDARVTLTSGWLKSPRLMLELEPPGTITFGGIIKARFDAKHTGGVIPLVSELLSAIPGLLLDGILVEGPLESPKVEPRSLGTGSSTPGTAAGRTPRLKPPRKVR